MLGGVQSKCWGVGPVPYLNFFGGTSQKKHPVHNTDFLYYTAEALVAKFKKLKTSPQKFKVAPTVKVWMGSVEIQVIYST